MSDTETAELIFTYGNCPGKAAPERFIWKIVGEIAGSSPGMGNLEEES